MERWMCARRTVHGDPQALKSRLLTDTAALLQAATGSEPIPPGGDGHVRMELRSADGRLRKGVSVHIGPARHEGAWTSIPLTWKADPLAGLFPSFEGHLEVEDEDVDRIGIAIIGHYTPPVALLGGIIDRVALSSQAEAMAEELVRGLVRALHDDVPHRPHDPERTVTVGDVLSQDVHVIAESASLRSAAGLLLRDRVTGAPVVDEHGALVGVLSVTDLLDKVAPPRHGWSRVVEMAWRRHGAATAGEACTRPALTTSVEASVRDAAAVMAEQRVGRLVAMRGATIAGLITRTDVVKALVRADEVVETAVEHLLAESGFLGVTPSVSDGVVTLTGVIDLRSDAAHLPERLQEEVDGVIDVDASDLTWGEDDVTIPPPMWI